MREAEAVDVVRTRVDPLAELLRGLGEAHARRDDRVDEHLRAVDRQDPVDILH